MIYKIFGPSLFHQIKKYIKHDYEIVISIPSKVQYPTDGYESEINYKIDCFYEMRKFFKNYLRNNNLNKSSVLI